MIYHDDCNMAVLRLTMAPTYAHATLPLFAYEDN